MLEFKSMKGNSYIFDDTMGLFIPFMPTMQAVVRELSVSSLSREDIIERLKGDFKEEDIAFYYDWIQKWKKFRSHNETLRDISHEALSNSSLKVYVLRNCLKQLILNVTEDCNFRCKYCAYSGNYEYTRTHSKMYMEFTVAKKAIDCYFSLLKDGVKYNPKRKPAVSFYGGEPLLNFDLIRKCVEYIKIEYSNFETRYNLTTNGSLLDENKADWLIKNNFSIMLSLDGPENEHNRNRLYRNGKGTFEDVMKNIIKLMNAYGTKTRVISTFDWRSDLFKLDAFFSKRDIPNLAIINSVSSISGCKYYDQFSEEDRLAFIEQIERAKTYYLKKFTDRLRKGKKDSVFDQLFGEYSLQIIGGFLPFRSTNSIMPFTSACVPGDRIFVDSRGNFQICEKVNDTDPIGNVDKGLNFEKIGRIISDYLHHMDKCSSCILRSACSYCYVQFVSNKGFLYSSEVCKEIESSRAKDLAMAFSIGEIDPAYFDMIKNGKLSKGRVKNVL